MEKRPELYVIREPETPVARKVFHLSGSRWLRQVAWRDHLRRAKNQAPTNSRKTD